ncbi:MAG: SUMF1/EgtB/PvdO family nonheme iron enzyme, partial [Planctomycetes bacterium]|nr:SUMF1/EgtB/PvdO family nonheme iron enzyme [Planctomycetota bacterium]
MTTAWPRWLTSAAILLLAGACQRIDPANSQGDRRTPKTETAQVVVSDSGVEMVLIPAGRFLMGSERGEPDELPVHEVAIDAFLMDRYEVTQAVYAKMDPINGSHFKGPELPTEMISWGKAALYCNLRSEAEGLEPCYNEFGECDFEATGYRLPTEAEWEYACRAGSDASYCYGSDSSRLDQYAWYSANAGKKTNPVGRKKPNAWGLFDMHGNVAEWCQDFYDPDYYRHSPAANPRGPAEGVKNVLRGGHWGSSADACQSARRFSEEPGFSDACFARDAIGFRCVRKAPENLTQTAVRHGPGPRLSPVVFRPTDAERPGARQGRGPDDTRHDGKVGLVYGDIYLQHNTGSGHPEGPERLTGIMKRLEKTGLISRLTAIPPRAASEAWLTSVHAPEYVARIRRLCEQGGKYADSRDTPVSPQSYAAALHAAGGVLEAVDAVMDGRVHSAFCAVRPPGHHALKDKAMGFCLFNNVAIAARYAQRKHKLKKILIVDWDVHHGNGTQAAFEEDPSVYYFSVHRSPFYPGTGCPEQRGTGKGFGTTRNVTLPAGSGDEVFG